MSFINISEVISKKFGKSGLAKSVTAALICDEFNKIVLEIWGGKMENMAQAMYLKDNVLTIACLSSVVTQEIKMKEGELLEKLNDKFGNGVVEKLRLLS